ncbi:MAG: anthranilate synthase component I family protein [Pirellulaceae bacterium]|nr:anthranilate synthase component I family protein [Pirellulaceae bacterium]
MIELDDELPIVEELHPAPDTEAALLALSQHSHCLFLDSALRDNQLGRYSFLTADPYAFLSVAADGSDGLAALEKQLLLGGPSRQDLPPFQGGAAGLFSYDLGRSLERIAAPQFDEFKVPAMAAGLYDTVVSFDHQQGRAWIVSQGFPERDPQARRERAYARVHRFRTWLTTPPANQFTWPASAQQDAITLVSRDELTRQYPVGDMNGLTSNFSADHYRRMIRRGIDYIEAGDVFQVNLAQRLLHPACDDPIALYRRLRRRNPATFAGYFDLGELQIVSASPERLVQCKAGRVEARPIKGTRPRGMMPAEDAALAEVLRESAKDRSENVMIVDLLRNDLARVCTPDSVQVTQLCGLESFAFVQHLVSVVRGRLADDRDALDLIRATFPGGSITGAPKVRAMEIIAELENTARGPYCGSLGYIGFDGTLDLSILIRTITAGRGWWQLPVGGGIVAQSEPQLEYEETWHKARGLLRSLAD